MLSDEFAAGLTHPISQHRIAHEFDYAVGAFVRGAHEVTRDAVDELEWYAADASRDDGPLLPETLRYDEPEALPN